MSWSTDRFILGTLEHRGACTAAELAEAGRLALGTVRNHLHSLQRSGAVVRMEGKQGPVAARYALAPSVDRAAEAFIRGALSDLLTGLDPIPNLSAAMWVLLGAGGEMTPGETAELRESGEELAGEQDER